MTDVRITPLSELLTPVWREVRVQAGSEYPVLGVRWYGEGLFLKGVKSGQGIKADRLYRVRAGDFVYNRLFAWKGSFALASEEFNDCYVSNEFPCFEIRNDRLDGRFLLWYFRREAVWTEALGLSSGATPTSRNRLKEKHLLAFKLPLPPLAEQRRVVSRIEELAEKISGAGAQRHQAREEAGALFASSVSRICFSSGWPMATLGDFVSRDSLRNGKSVKSSDGADGIRCLTLSALRRGRIDSRASKPVPLGAAEAKPFLVRREDVFIVRGSGSRELCGQAGLNLQDCDKTIFPDLFIRIPLPTDRISPKFFVTVWNSRATRATIEDQAKTTSGIWKINQGHIVSMRIPLPLLSEQNRVMAELDALQGDIEALEKLQAETAIELDALLPAILDRAFKSELA